MSGEIKFTQEKENMILELKDMVNAHSKNINKMVKVINAQKKIIEELEVKLIKINNSRDFNDIFRKVSIC